MTDQQKIDLFINDLEFRDKFKAAKSTGETDFSHNGTLFNTEEFMDWVRENKEDLRTANRSK
jgi:hypothetical protein